MWKSSRFQLIHLKAFIVVEAGLHEQQFLPLTPPPPFPHRKHLEKKQTCAKFKYST